MIWKQHLAAHKIVQAIYCELACACFYHVQRRWVNKRRLKCVDIAIGRVVWLLWYNNNNSNNNNINNGKIDRSFVRSFGVWFKVCFCVLSITNTTNVVVTKMISFYDLKIVSRLCACDKRENYYDHIDHRTNLKKKPNKMHNCTCILQRMYMNIICRGQASTGACVIFFAVSFIHSSSSISTSFT